MNGFDAARSVGLEDLLMKRWQKIAAVADL
jgi:hypothetical protein